MNTEDMPTMPMPTVVDAAAAGDADGNAEGAGGAVSRAAADVRSGKGSHVDETGGSLRVGAGDGADAIGGAVGADGKPGGAANGTASAGCTPCISARGLGLKTYAGWVYRNVNLDLRKGEVAAVRGRNGSGKTALLLTLAGRMKQGEGALSVCGFTLPRQRAKAQRHVGLGLVSGLNDLQESLTAVYAVSAELGLHGRSPRRAQALSYLERWGLADIAGTRVKDLTSEQLARLGIALAFAGDPDAVVVDDIEDQLTLSQSKELMGLLLRTARERDAAIAVGVVERSLAEMADQGIYLAKEGE